MKILQNVAAQGFIVAVAVLSGLSVLGVWELLGEGMVAKSFQTIGLLAAVAAVILIAGKFIDSKSQDGTVDVQPVINQSFPIIRGVTLVILVAAVSLLALLGILSIWEVISDKDVLYKSLGSLAVVAFGAFIIVLTCLERENKLSRGGHVSVGRIVGIVFLAFIAYLFISIFTSF